MNSYVKTMVKAVLIGMIVGLVFAMLHDLRMSSGHMIFGWGVCGLWLSSLLNIVRYLRRPKQKVKHAPLYKRFLRRLVDDALLAILIIEVFHIVITLPFIVSGLTDPYHLPYFIANIPFLIFTFVYTFIYAARYAMLPVVAGLLAVRLAQFIWQRERVSDSIQARQQKTYHVG